MSTAPAEHRHDRAARILLRELSHRVRNNLAGLLGLVSLYERSGKDAREIGLAIRGKVRAMKEVHDMISPCRSGKII